MAEKVDQLLVDAVKVGFPLLEAVGVEVRVVEIERVPLGLEESLADWLAAAEPLACVDGEALMLEVWLLLPEVLVLGLTVLDVELVRVLVVEKVDDHVITSVAVEVRVSIADIEGLALADRVAVLVSVPLRDGVAVCVGVLAAVDDLLWVDDRVVVPDTDIDRVALIDRLEVLLAVVLRVAVLVREGVELCVCTGETDPEHVEDTVPLLLLEVDAELLVVEDPVVVLERDELTVEDTDIV